MMRKIFDHLTHLFLILPFLISICTLLNSGCSAKENRQYAVAKLPTPVLNTDEFAAIFGGKDGKSLKLDQQGFIRELEMIALPETVFLIQEVIAKPNNTRIYCVEMEDYPYPNEKGYYIDSRFVELTTVRPPEREKKILSRDEIIQNLIASEGVMYTWGGNIKNGIPQMLEWYPPSEDISDDLKDKWSLKGVDCSGLLYEATDGYTPRNTSSLVDYGVGLDIAGKKAEEIIKQIEAVDLIVWKGHVIIVLDSTRSIQSTFPEGVKIESLNDTLSKVWQNRVPVNHYDDPVNEGMDSFVIRRWYPM